MQDHELKRLDPPMTWDNTMRSQLLDCPRKLYFFLRRFDYPSDQKPLYFLFGEAWHEGMAVWHTRTDLTPSKRLDLATQAALKIWAAYANQAGIDPALLRDKTHNQDLLVSKLRAYTKRYKKEAWSLVKGGSELGWEWPLEGTPFFLAGSIDGYLKWTPYGMFALEHKTSSGYLSQAFLDAFEFSTQITQYSWYLSNLLGPEVSKGVLVDCMTKKVKTERSNWSTFEFDRTRVHKSLWQLEEFEQDIRFDLNFFIEHHWNDWYWPKKGLKNPIMCCGGPGRSACLFRPACLSPLDPAQIEAERFGWAELTEPWQPWLRSGSQT